jgi:hypothetical protein
MPAGLRLGGRVKTACFGLACLPAKAAFGIIASGADRPEAAASTRKDRIRDRRVRPVSERSEIRRLSWMRLLRLATDFRRSRAATADGSTVHPAGLGFVSEGARRVRGAADPEPSLRRAASTNRRIPIDDELYRQTTYSDDERHGRRTSLRTISIKRMEASRAGIAPRQGCPGQGQHPSRTKNPCRSQSYRHAQTCFRHTDTHTYLRHTQIHTTSDFHPSVSLLSVAI